jgi:hypothetical protein
MSYYVKIPDKDYYLALANRPQARGTVSQYRGVTRGNYKNPYRAQFSYQGRRYYLGNYATELDAAKAYNRAALAVIGPHAVLNDLSHSDELH